MTGDWQNWAAAGIVLLTAGIFVYRIFAKPKKGKSSSSCGHNCGCGKTTPSPK